MVDKVLFTSNKEDWETPDDLFEQLDNKYHLKFDLAASAANKKCNNYYSVEDDSLSKQWNKLEGGLWLNPPYGRSLGKWIKKAYETSLVCDNKIVVLIPARTDTSYWHDYIFGKAHIYFIRGRIKFEQNGQKTNPAPFPSAVIIYNDGSGVDVF